MHSNRNCLSPEVFREILVMQHGPYRFDEGAVQALCHAVLIRVTGDSQSDGALCLSLVKVLLHRVG